MFDAAGHRSAAKRGHSVPIRQYINLVRIYTVVALTA
jgi:hypothetical protein